MNGTIIIMNLVFALNIDPTINAKELFNKHMQQYVYTTDLHHTCKLAKEVVANDLHIILCDDNLDFEVPSNLVIKNKKYYFIVDGALKEY